MNRRRLGDRRRSSQDRLVDEKNTIPQFLIVCEGAETEPNYFRSFRIASDIRNVDVRGVGHVTESLVRKAIDLSEGKAYDQVWCVMDHDGCEAGQFNRALDLAQRNNISIAYSNICFELWYVLHFHYHASAQTYDQYEKRLSRDLGIKYEKTIPDMYHRILFSQNTAIKNAKRLLKSYSDHKPAKDDPCTTVHLLVEELNKYVR